MLSVFNRNYLNLVVITNILLFLFPIGINVLKGSGDLILFFIAIIGLVKLINGQPLPSNSKAFGLFCWAMLGYFGVLVLSVAFSGKAAELSRYLARDLHFLFAPLVLLALWNVKINIRLVFLGIKLSLIVMGLIILYQWYGGHDRPSGVMNAGVFGNLSVMTFFLLIAYSLLYINRINYLSVLALIFGIISIVLSGTRGAWLSFIFLFLLCSWFVLCYSPINKKSILVIFNIIIFGLSSFVIINSDVKSRLSHAKVQTHEWLSQTNKNSSVGLRLEMYKASLLSLDEMPLLTGYGYRNANTIVSGNADEGVAGRIKSFNHLHNAYITNLLSNGVLGLMALLFVLFFPVRYFFTTLGVEDKKLWSLCGLLLCVGYASFGWVNVLLGDVFMNAYYVFFLALFYGQAHRIDD